MVTCQTCGYMGTRLANGEFGECDSTVRDIGMVERDHVMNAYPACFREAFDLRNLAMSPDVPGNHRHEKIHVVITDPRTFAKWAQWVPSLSPKDHLLKDT